LTVESLFNVPTDQRGLDYFATANADHHTRLAESIFAAGGTRLLVQPLDPIPLFARDVWLQKHQQMHNDLNKLLGTTGFDLSALDIENEEEVAAWVGLHAREHYRFADGTGVF
jgi:hypothetical protein